MIENTKSLKKTKRRVYSKKKVYYNQADSRWANHPYPSRELPKATIKSGGCGPTCAAMVVSSFKETIIR